MNVKTTITMAIKLLITASLPFILFVIMKVTGIAQFDSCYEHVGASDHANQLHVCKYTFYVGMEWLAVFSAGISMGVIGAATNHMLLNANRRDEQDISAWATLAILLFGAVFAFILILIFLGGFIQGSLFPNMTSRGWISIYLSMSDWAKLMVWCFIAGFSERFVPNFFQNLIRKVDPDKHHKAPPEDIGREEKLNDTATDSGGNGTR